MNIDPTRSGPAAAAQGGVARTSAGDAFDLMMKQFMEEARKTPEQRAREKVLEKHELTEESYRALSADERASIDKEVAQEALRIQEQRRAGLAGNRRPA